jgi:hypothetical protein
MQGQAVGGGELTGYPPGEVSGDKEIRVKVRLDFKGTAKPARFIFGGKPIEKVAEETREQHMSMFRNVPMQGIHIGNIDMGLEVYTVYDDVNNIDVAYAPVILEIQADSLEDLMKFVAREDFRKIEVLSPNTLALQRYDVERLVFRVSEEIRNFKSYMERKYNLK